MTHGHWFSARGDDRAGQPQLKLGKKQIEKIFLAMVNAYGSLKIETGSPLSRWKNSSA
jgi:hypothetical protein